jgi:hypothetical protein
MDASVPYAFAWQAESIRPGPDLATAARVYSLERTGGQHDFDFLAGSWLMTNWRLRQRGVGRRDWDIFTSHLRAWTLLGGVANGDEVVFPTKGWSGTTFRHFDVEKRQWSIYWVNSRDGKLQAPVTGGFDGDVGLFYGEDIDEGRPVLVEYRWTRLSPNRARWEQAFSYDGGETWEVNWVNVLERDRR